MDHIFINNVPDNARHQPLVLKKQTTSGDGHVWSLQVCDGTETDADLKGQKLHQLFRNVAEGKLLDAELSALGQNPTFQALSQQQTQHRAKISAIKQRIFAHAKTIGKGLAKIERKGYEGRTVDSGKIGEPGPGYWFREIVQQENPRPARELAILRVSWEEGASPLSFTDWEAAKRLEHQHSGSSLEFMPWIHEQTFNLLEKKAWEKEAPSEDFAAWKSRQVDPDLAPPLWMLKQIYEDVKKNTGETYSFEEWKQKDPFPMLEAESKRINDRYGLQLSSREVDEKLHIWEAHSGFTGTFDRYLLKELWKAEDKPGDLNTYIDNRMYNQELATGTTTATSLGEWKQTKEADLRARHQGSHLPISFEIYKKTQYDDPLAEPAPFVLLNAQERKIYQTACKDGMLTRNSHPFDTAHERTRHSGDKPAAIFVIGPNNDLYCGSHIDTVFHHSSFLGEAAIAAAGEVKTDSNGKIVELSAKSGHYKPTDRQNLYMLRYFQDRGVDLSKVDFSYWGEKGEMKENAKEYLDRIEHLEGLSKMDPSLFK